MAYLHLMTKKKGNGGYLITYFLGIYSSVMLFQFQFPHSNVMEITDVEHLLSAAEEAKPLSTLYSVLAGLDTSSKVSQLFSV